MRRYNSPYDGKQYLINTNTGEIHNLDLEQDACQINEIKKFRMFDTHHEALMYAAMFGVSNADGCFYCNTSNHHH